MTDFAVFPIRISKECTTVSPAIYGVCLIINVHSDYYHSTLYYIVKGFLTVFVLSF